MRALLPFGSQGTRGLSHFLGRHGPGAYRIQLSLTRRDPEGTVQALAATRGTPGQQHVNPGWASSTPSSSQHPTTMQTSSSQSYNGNGSNGNGGPHGHNGNGNGKPHHSPEPVVKFTGSSVPELQQWLEANGVDTSGYGTGLAKTVADLLEEQAREESVLSIDNGRPLRTVRVLSLHVMNDAGQVLFEDEQILPDGRSRRRQVAVSEKLVGDEPWQEAVHRAIQEELAMALPQGYQVEVLHDTYKRLEELSTSMSYPGLVTKYVFHRVSARLPGLPTGPFETWEPRPGGQLVTRWVWREVSQVEELEAAAPTASTG